MALGFWQECVRYPLQFSAFFAAKLLVAQVRFSEDADILIGLAYLQEQPLD